MDATPGKPASGAEGAGAGACACVFCVGCVWCVCVCGGSGAGPCRRHGAPANACALSMHAAFIVSCRSCRPARRGSLCCGCGSNTAPGLWRPARRRPLVGAPGCEEWRVCRHKRRLANVSAGARVRPTAAPWVVNEAAVYALCPIMQTAIEKWRTLPARPLCRRSQNFAPQL
jgi:hypothetical protein